MYILGKDNRRANALSRRLDIIGEKKINRNTILQQNKDSSLKLNK